MSKRIAYFINTYPAVSHAFIRREMRALEKTGFEIQRIALRGWNSPLVDPEDEEERAATRYVLQQGLWGLIQAFLLALFTRPGRFFSAAALAVKMGLHADRPMLLHFVYLAEACRMLPWLEAFGARHVHAHFGSNSAEIVQLAHALGGPPYSFTVHGPTEFDKPRALHIGDKVEYSAFVVAITHYCRSQLYRWVRHESWDKVKVVRCGLEPEYFQSQPVPVPDAAKLVCLGRIVEQKGQLLLVEAAAKVIKAGRPFELVLIGAGPMRAQVEARAKALGVETQVRFTGALSTERLREEILGARGLILPSFAEGLPMVFMEAMAMRRPILTTHIAGHPELIRPGENGWLFPAGSVDEIAQAIEDCLSRSPEELTQMGLAGYELARRLHCADQQAVELGALFDASIAKAA